MKTPVPPCRRAAGSRSLIRVLGAVAAIGSGCGGPSTSNPPPRLVTAPEETRPSAPVPDVVAPAATDPTPLPPGLSAGSAKVASPAKAAAIPAGGNDEGTRVAAAVEKVLRKHAAEVHRCFEVSLADRIDTSGKLEIEVTIGDGGRVKDAALFGKADTVTPALADCVIKAARTWTVSDIEAGAAVVLPFALAAEMNQFVVKRADVPARGPQARGGREAPFSVKILADPVNVRAREFSVALLNVSPASRVAMHRHPASDKAIYVLRGRARILGPAGEKPITVGEGDALFIPKGFPHVIENMGRQIPVEMLQVFTPPGPERVYRDPNDAAGRAAFEVIRDANIKAPAGATLVFASGKDVAPTVGPGATSGVRLLLHPANIGSKALALSLVELAAGSQSPRAPGGAESEFSYVLSGGGTLQVGSESQLFSAECALFVPSRQPHGVKIGPEKTVLVRVVAAAGAP